MTDKSNFFYNFLTSIENLKKRYITNRQVYICRDKKRDPERIIVKFSRKHWILLKADGTWEYLESEGNKTVHMMRNGEI